MLRYYYINKEWMLSHKALSVYRIAASLSILLFFMLVYLRRTAGVPPGVAPMIRLLLLAGLLGAATTMVGMEYFLFGFDKSSAWKRALWFCVTLFFPLGPALYCFAVYSRSSLVQRSKSTSPGIVTG